MNPFATGVASDAAGISISDGIGLRLVMLFVLVPVADGLRDLVRPTRPADPTQLPSTAAVAGQRWRSIADGGDAGDDVPPLTGRQKVVWCIFGSAFVIMIYGFIPWNDVWNNDLRRRLPAADVR